MLPYINYISSTNRCRCNNVGAIIFNKADKRKPMKFQVRNLCCQALEIDLITRQDTKALGIAIFEKYSTIKRDCKNCSRRSNFGDTCSYTFS